MAGDTKKYVSLAGHGVLGWAICGATVGTGRQLVSLDATLLIHAIVAPIAFGALAWHYKKRFPESSAARTALTMTAIVVGLDALVVAPFVERSYAMFRSAVGTWVPFTAIAGATYFVVRAVRSTPNSIGVGGGPA